MTDMITPSQQRQLELEVEMQGLGASRFRARTDKALENGRGAETLPGSYLVKKAVEPLADAIGAFLCDAARGRPGPRQVAAVYLEQIKPEVAAYVTVRSVLNCCIGKPRKVSRVGTPLLNVANSVASPLEAEVRINSFAQQNSGLLAHMERKLSKDGATVRHQRSVLFHTMGKMGIEWEPWSKTDKIHLGMKLVELMQEATGLISLDYGPAMDAMSSKYKTMWSVCLEDAVVDWIDHQFGRSELLHPFRMPMTIRPTDWSSLNNGGYLTETLRVPVSIAPTREHTKLLKEADLSQLYKGLNAIQSTAWTVNTPILEVADTFATNGIQVGELSVLQDEIIPDKPHDIATNIEARAAWKKEARSVHLTNHVRRGERLRHSSVLSLAQKFRDEPQIYFPHRVDFRGRAYPIPIGLQPQGSDVVKSLLQFSSALPIGTPEAAQWLAIQGANVWGADKISLEDRVKWAEEHSPQIDMVATDPYSNRWWTEADKPWGFLAFCFEWQGYMRKGLDHLSTLPIAMDGSCNGLQHFSAMLRDPVGGQAVNLIPSDTPQDIYQSVADRTVDKLKVLVREPEDHQQSMWAETWLQLGIDRKVTKRPVMVLPYGGTFQSCIQYIREATEDKINATGGANPFGDDYPKAIGLLARLVWDSIGEVVVAARDAMDWLQQVARVVSKENLPLHWTTPLGFPVLQHYKNMKKRQVKTKFNGGLIYLSTRESTDRLNKPKQSLAVSPNYVHSMDAAAMFLTINRLVDEGITSFAMIHDSYGTHAANSTKMAKAIRQTFVDMYQGDVLALFKEQIASQLPEEAIEKLPPLPEKGTLDLSGVLDSDFFFA